jgi:hypothetical protein
MKKAVRLCLLFGCLAGYSCLDLLYAQNRTPKNAEVRILVKSVEMISQNEAHVKLTLINESTRTIFFTVNPFDVNMPEPLYLEQMRQKEGWTLFGPCVDNPPAAISKLKPGKTIGIDDRIGVPTISNCQVKPQNLLDSFRYSLEYFESYEDVRAYMRNFFPSSNPKRPHPRIVYSESFSIPGGWPRSR